MYKLITADVMDWLNLANRYGYRQNYYHAMLLDPPYHLTSINKRFSKGTQAKFGTDGAYQRASAGFMGQTWDGGDLAFTPELWVALKEMLLPGAFCFAFAGSRGWHRMATAIEDAGFIMHPTIFLWAYGSGFPKATRIDTQIDKAAGTEREVIGKGISGKMAIWADGGMGNYSITKPATPEAAQWEGHRYGLQAIKPATEPILCFQKPYEDRPLDNIIETGAGAINIDRGRIDSVVLDGERRFSNSGKHAGVVTFGLTDNRPPQHEGGRHHPKGRWPANLLLQHHPDCKRVGEKRVKTHWSQPTRGTRKNSTVNIGPKDDKTLGDSIGYADPAGLETVADWQCVDECPVKKLDLQSGESKSKASLFPRWRGKDKNEGWKRPAHESYPDIEGGHNDSGGASRFFYQSHFAYEIAEQIAAADPVRYVAKVGNKERNAGLDDLVNQTKHRTRPDKGELTGLNKEPRWGPVETKNIHPTVKPIALTKYLASLLLPPEAYKSRRILCPFAGSGSEMIGAMLAGWDEVTGIEMTQKYIPIAKARLVWWSHYLKWGQDDIDIILDAIHEDDGQLSFIEEITQ